MSCNSGSISPYVPSTQKPWDKKLIQHFYRRIGFGATLNEISNALIQEPSVFIDGVIDGIVELSPTSPPPWAYMKESDYSDINAQMQEQHSEWYLEWENDMLVNPIRGRFTLFWSNHFVTRLEDYWCSSWMFDYYKVIQENSFGNFKEFVKKIGLTPAMLIFLNGYQNTAAEPNENYARELYELFTLGVNNGYTQTDIVETARALTGYTAINEYCAPISFDNSDFDQTEKTIFGRTGNWGYNEVIDILFEEKSTQIANFICQKLYKYFVSPEINTTIISELSKTLILNNFELIPVYKQLFKSEHFFDSNAIGIIVKSPFDLLNSYFRETEFITESDMLLNLVWFCGEIGQKMLEPIDVAGWKGNHDWVNSGTLVGRWKAFDYLLWWNWEQNKESFRTLVINLVGEINNPAEIVKTIVNHFISNGLQTTLDYEIATDVFKSEIPQNYFDNNEWNLQWDSVPYQTILLLFHIIRLPEFQLK
jgi:hypothetical protein